MRSLRTPTHRESAAAAVDLDGALRRPVPGALLAALFAAPLAERADEPELRTRRLA